jgi:hypothetical protein
VDRIEKSRILRPGSNYRRHFRESGDAVLVAVNKADGDRLTPLAQAGIRFDRDNLDHIEWVTGER